MVGFVNTVLPHGYSLWIFAAIVVLGVTLGITELQSSGVRCKMMEDTLGYLLSCRTAVAGLVRLSREKDCQESCEELAEWDKLLTILKSRLLHVLLSLMKLYSKLKKG